MGSPYHVLHLTAGYEVGPGRFTWARETIRSEYLERAGWELVARIARLLLAELSLHGDVYFGEPLVDRTKVQWHLNAEIRPASP